MSAKWSVGMVRDESTPAMAIASKSLSPAARQVLHKGAAEPLLALVRRHLSGLAQSRHATAESLGAAPTGKLGDAARRTFSSATPESASVTVPGPLFSRTFRDVVIRPKPPGKALAIPLHKWAYGLSPRDWDRRHADNPLVKIGKGLGVLYAKFGGQKRGVLTPMYILVASVHQRQDRSLLPSDDDLAAAAREGVLGVIQAAMDRARGKSEGDTQQ